jgi:TetR/AcrR family transcriptional regulator, acrAB operon repressor
MVRKTKEDAEITRQRIIHAAREMFLLKGVSRTSLEQIASHAGVTRGAVYWHFKNKAELFYAMREQVFLPLIDRMDDTLLSDQELTADSDPLSRIEKSLLDTIKELDHDLATRQTYEVMMSKCEYVDEFADVLQDILNNCSGIVEKYESAYEKAQKLHMVQSTLSAKELAMDTHLFFSGLLHMWVKDADGSLFRNRAQTLIQTHIKLRRMHPK